MININELMQYGYIALMFSASFFIIVGAISIFISVFTKKWYWQYWFEKEKNKE